MYAQSGKPNTQTPVDSITTSPINSKVTNIIPSKAGDSLAIEADSTSLPKAKGAIPSQVKYSADDSIDYNAEKQEVYLYGNAAVEYEDITLKAAYIKIELAKTLVHANGIKDSIGKSTGTPIFNQAGTEYKVERVSYNYKTKKGYLSDLRTKEGEGYVRGTDVIRTPDNEFGIKKSYYTTCELDTPHFHIQAAKLKIIPDKKIVTGPANLQIAGMPTPLVVPFGIFSIKRGQSSGIIIPTYGNSENRGFFLRGGGYYIGLGEKADYMVTGDIFTQGSWALNNLLRYSNRYRYNGQLGVNFANNKFGNFGDPSFSQNKDLRINWLHNVDPKARPGTIFGANVNYITPFYLRNNSYVPTNITANQIISSINYSKSFSGGKYNLNTNASMSQNLTTRQLSVGLPNLTFTVSSFNPFKAKSKPTAEKWYENISANYTLNFRNELNTYDTLLTGKTSREIRRYLDTTLRNGMQHSIPIQTSFKLFKYYTLSASVQLNETWYLQSVNKEYVNGAVVTNRVDGFVRAFTYSPRVGLNTRWYGMKSFKGNTIKAIRHVVSPTVDFSYTPDYGDASRGYYKSYKDTAGNEFKYSIFEGGIFGGPGLGRQGNIGFGIDNNIEMKVMRGKDTARKEEKVQIFESLRAGSSYNIFADSLNLAPFFLSARTRLYKNITINGNATLDPYNNQIVVSSLGNKTVNRVNEFYFGKGKLGKITSGDIGLSASFNPETFRKKSEERRKKYANERNYIHDNPMDYYDFNIPWNLAINYTVRYNAYNNLNNSENSNFVQTLNLSGDFNLTKNWKIAGTSGYDLQNKQVTFTSVDIIRDLHCWTFKLTWIPIGFRQSFFFQINVRASMLQDLKLTRRREWFDSQL